MYAVVDDVGVDDSGDGGDDDDDGDDEIMHMQMLNTSMIV